MGRLRVLAWEGSLGTGRHVPQRCRTHCQCACYGPGRPGCTSPATPAWQRAA